MATSPIRLIIADDHPIVVDGIRARLLAAISVKIVGVARNFEEVIDLTQQHRPQVIILDISGMRGSVTTTVNHLQRDFPEIGILVFSSLVDLAPELIRAGVAGYVTKDEISEYLPLAVTRVAEGNCFYSPYVEEYLESSLLKHRRARLTESESTLLKLLAQGMSTFDIADELKIDPRTVQNKLTGIRRKTGCIERTQLVEWYRMMQKAESV